jgi:hypothetical protein
MRRGGKEGGLRGLKDAWALGAAVDAAPAGHLQRGLARGGPQHTLWQCYRAVACHATVVLPATYVAQLLLHLCLLP